MAMTKTLGGDGFVKTIIGFYFVILRRSSLQSDESVRFPAKMAPEQVKETY